MDRIADKDAHDLRKSRHLARQEKRANTSPASEDIVPLPAAPVHKQHVGPVVVTFQDPWLNRRKSSAKPAAPTNTPATTTTKKQDFAMTNKYIEQLAASNLTGADRRRYMSDKLTQLCLPLETRDKKHLPRVPMPMAIAMIKSAKERALKKQDEDMAAGGGFLVSTADKQTASHCMNPKKPGVVTHVWSSNAHPMKSTFDKKLRKERVKGTLGIPTRTWMDRGMKIDIGKFKNGTLHISKEEIRSVTSQGAKKPFTKRPRKNNKDSF